MSRKQVLILGGGGIASIASWIMDRRGDAEAIGLLNDVYKVGDLIGKKKKIEVLGTSDDVKHYIEDTDYEFFIAYHGMQREQEVYEKICGLGIPIERLYSPIDPTASIAYEYSDLGAGILAGPYSQIGPDSTIGNNTVILGNAFVGHDTNIGEFCHIATNAVVGACCNIGNACHIGMNSTIREKTIIKDYALVGMGSVVVNDIEKNNVVVGNPASVLRVKNKGGI